MVILLMNLILKYMTSCMYMHKLFNDMFYVKRSTYSFKISRSNCHNDMWSSYWKKQACISFLNIARVARSNCNIFHGYVLTTFTFTVRCGYCNDATYNRRGQSTFWSNNELTAWWQVVPPALSLYQVTGVRDL
jgi:hypothetical protein